MNSFCTVFDSNYLSRGLVLYSSLARTASPFELWVLAVDDQCAAVLSKLDFPHLKVWTMSEVETPELLAVKPLRSVKEYIWTCTPLFLRHCMTRSKAPAWTYVDPDVMFFASPALLLGEMGDASMLVTEHRFSPAYQLEEACGRYCVHFNTFRRTEIGLKALHWWCEKCLEWCYARHEEGRFGDQKYLDDFPTRYHGVHVARHVGAGLGPWNVDSYELTGRGDEVIVQRDGFGEGPLVFYHFHAMQFLSAERVILAAGYAINRDAVDLIYRPYLRSLLATGERLAAPNPHGIQRPSLRRRLGMLRRRVTLGVKPFDISNVNAT